MICAIMRVPSVARSSLFLVLAVMLTLTTVIHSVTAQEATPGMTAEALAAYPELRIRATDEGLVEVPSQVEAGRYLMVLENGGTHNHTAYLVQPPAGRTVTGLVAETTPEAAGPPAWFFEQTFLGGPGEVAAGQQARAIVDLVPGEYGVLDTIGAASGVPNWLVPLDVIAGSQATPTPAVGPRTDVSIEMQAFEYTGLPERVAPGQHVWQVTNISEQPFAMAVAKAPEGTTAQDVPRAVAAMFGGTPSPSALDLQALVAVGGLGPLSPGQMAWTVLDLEPGTYVAWDFFGAPMGMVAVFTVEE